MKAATQGTIENTSYVSKQTEEERVAEIEMITRRLYKKRVAMQEEQVRPCLYIPWLMTIGR